MRLQTATLFEPPPAPPPTVETPSDELSARRRQRGIRRAETNGGPEWAAECDLLLRRYLETHHDLFVDEWWPWATSRGLQFRGKAFGSRLLSARREGWIRADGFRPSNRSNGSPKTLWQSRIYTGPES